MYQHTILLIDPDVTFRDILARHLSRNQFLPLGVGTGAAALVHRGRGDIRLVVLELRLPDMDGAVLALRLRTEFQCPDLPVLALTADQSRRLVETSLGTAMNEYLFKPSVTMPEILSAISRHVGGE